MIGAVIVWNYALLFGTGVALPIKFLVDAEYKAMVFTLLFTWGMFLYLKVKGAKLMVDLPE